MRFSNKAYEKKARSYDTNQLEYAVTHGGLYGTKANEKKIKFYKATPTELSFVRLELARRK
jgi:hypothetical protein